MGAAEFVIPLAALALPIVLILAAVLIDIVVLTWFAYTTWRDDWAIRLGRFASDHFMRPLQHVARAHRTV
jgi:hypothetical protein